MGIDGALLADSGALLKEIPGGCMCCVNGLPMQVGLNTLLRQGKPDRLLIEPTGLGHPKQILDILTAAVYEPWIDLRATLCVLDPPSASGPEGGGQRKLPRSAGRRRRSLSAIKPTG
nr:metal chaperone [Raoultella sp. NCTC 9187]